MPRYGPGATTKRGYGAHHQALRRSLAPAVAAGGVKCARCGFRIAPGEDWDLGHDRNDRSRYLGPEHVGCNRDTNSKKPKRRQSRRW